MTRTTSTLIEVDLVIQAVISSPATSDWLRYALAASFRRDPVDVLTDAECLVLLLRERLNAIEETSNNDIER
jgi:hypothetical protein